MQERPRKARVTTRRIGSALLALTTIATAGGAAPARERIPDLFAQFRLPDAWCARFWADPHVRDLLALGPRALADMVPVQAGLRFCRCPACDASEADDPLSWSIARPKVLTCRSCGVVVPNELYPAKDEKEKKVPEEVVDVLPRVQHRYPYHAVAPEKQRYPEERLYLEAKRDYELRQFLAKAALYAAVRHHAQAPGSRDPALARLACVLVLRFAQVYPAYATHYDQPNTPKFFQQADLPPPYRRGYRTGKWDWVSSLDIPLNLLIAYALVRDDPCMREAGQALGDPHPERTIERDLFGASAEFVRLQPEEYNEMSLQAYRGLLAVGRLLDDPAMVHEVLARLDGFAERGFYHDGFWRQGDLASHRRIVGLIDGWIDRLLDGYADPPGFAVPEGQRRLEIAPHSADVPMLALAREAGSLILGDPPASEVQRVSWPAPEVRPVARHPALLGGAGMARLAVGRGPAALDLELRGQDSLGAAHFQAQALRLAVGGRPVLGDLDDLPATATGWDRATASHNTVVVDGLNQRESIVKASEPAPGGDFLFFAADPDFQVVALDDRRAYPQSTTRYRQTLIAASAPRSSYAVAIFEVHGGLQHDQIFHAAAGGSARWQVSVPTVAAPASLLPPSVPYVPSARAEDGRWFVQAYGEFTPLLEGRLSRPAMASLGSPGLPGVRLHLLGETPASVVTVSSPDPSPATAPGAAEEPSRSGLIVRRRSEQGGTLKSVFVTVFEPTGSTVPLARVGRVASPDETVVLYLETADGPEHLVVNLAPGSERTVTLADGQRLTTDGLAARASARALILAGGTFVETAGRRVEQGRASGKITGASRRGSDTSRGWFQADAAVVTPDALAGRVLLIRHGDGTTRGWTLDRVENSRVGARFHVREEPGFTIDSENSGIARYYQFPRVSAPGPHRYEVSTLAR